MRREPDFFGESELALLYIAKRLREALKLEEWLTAASVDYLVETDYYTGGVVFRSERAGAFFYVPQNSLESARQVLRANGIKAPVSAQES
jgi:hypothetical protein